MSKRDDLKHVLQMAREHGMSDDALIDAILSNTKDPEPAAAPSEPTDGRSAARLRRGLERLWVAAASSEQRDDEIDLLRMDRDLIAAALAARSSQSAAEVES